jgi:nucleoside-diphosphate-sugar epimerase
MKFTVFGGAGFVGSRLVSTLSEKGHECRVPGRDEILDLEKPLGHAVWCIGLTSDFRERPFDTMEAHAGLLAEVLRRARFVSFTYLSSTRVYRRCKVGDERALPHVDPTDPMDLYDISKLAGEALCLGMDRPQARVARISNVYGGDFDSGNFLSSVLTDAARKYHVHFATSPRSEKDYVHVDDVAWALERIALAGRERVYNVASGTNVSNGAIARHLKKIGACTTEFATAAPVIRMPPVKIERLAGEFGFTPRALLDDLAELIEMFRKGAG